MKILFVCTGNTCRSPMARALFEKILKENSCQNILCDSAGIFCSNGEVASKNAILACKDEKIDISNHKTKNIITINKNDFDLFVVMNSQHKEILKSFNVPLEKIHILNGGINDPYGKNLSEYKLCKDQILNGVKKLYKEVKNEN